MDVPDPDSQLSPVQLKLVQLGRRYQTLLDSTTPFIIPRWSAVVVFYEVGVEFEVF